MQVGLPLIKCTLTALAATALCPLITLMTRIIIFINSDSFLFLIITVYVKDRLTRGEYTFNLQTKAALLGQQE